MPTKPPYQSPRGLPLIWSSTEPPKAPTLTVELYPKWYNLHLVMPSGQVTEIQYFALRPRPNGPAYVDHVPNPASVSDLVHVCKWEMDELAFELIVGRWALEIEGAYP